MKVNLDSLINQYLDDFMSHLSKKDLYDYARECFEQNLRTFTESEVINFIDEYYTAERFDERRRNKDIHD